MVESASCPQGQPAEHGIAAAAAAASPADTAFAASLSAVPLAASSNVKANKRSCCTGEQYSVRMSATFTAAVNAIDATAAASG
jgi:hypothetical protein